jgi:hypothetical protein
MPKPVALTPGLVEAPQITPRAATPSRGAREPAKASEKADYMPLQLRLPRGEIQAIKIAAIQREQTISEFMLACFHECMKGGEHAKRKA